MKRFDGQKNPERRRLLEAGEPLAESLADEIVVVDVHEYVKLTTTFAVRLEEAFEVDTLEGRHSAKAGDYLAIGRAGEMYPIDAAVFAATYVKAERDSDDR